MELLDKNYTCCFTGHRLIEKAHKEKLPAALENAVRGFIADGYFIFVSGGTLGFDTMAAEMVLKLKEEFSSLRLIIAAPYAGQSERWSAEDKLKYERLINACDDYACLSSAYSPDCMRQRNRFLVECSAAMIAYCVRERSGSSQTVGFAKAAGLETVNLARQL